MTADLDFLADHVAELLVEIARFWVDLAEIDPGTGRYSILDVVITRDRMELRAEVGSRVAPITVAVAGDTFDLPAGETVVIDLHGSPMSA